VGRGENDHNFIMDA